MIVRTPLLLQYAGVCCLISCSTAPNPPLEDLLGQWSLALTWEVPNGKSCHLEGVVFNITLPPQGQPVAYSAALTGGSGACTIGGQSLPIEAQPRSADSVFYSQGSFRMVIGKEQFTGTSAGTRLNGRYEEQLSGSPSEDFLVTGSWSATRVD